MEEVTSSSQEQIFYKIGAFWKARAKGVGKLLSEKKNLLICGIREYR